MKTLFFVAIISLLSVSTAYGASKLIKGEEMAQVGLGDQAIVISRVNDGDTTCYVSRSVKNGSHAISCVK